MRVFELGDDLGPELKLVFYSMREYRELGGNLPGEFVAAMEVYLYHYEDSQEDPTESVNGIWTSEADNPDSLGGVANELLNIPEEDFELDGENGMILLRQWSPELFMSTSLTLDDVASLEGLGDAE
jgi:hypothetical protein